MAAVIWGLMGGISAFVSPFLQLQPIPIPDKAWVGMLMVREAGEFFYRCLPVWVRPSLHPPLRLLGFDLHSLLLALL